MKLFPVLLAGSIAANLALAAALLWWSPETRPASDARLASDRSGAPDSTAAMARGAATSAAATKSWDRLRTDDLAALVARLRAAGFPSAMITAIVREQVDEQFAARRRELTAATEKPYWKTRADAPTDPKVEQALTALGREERDLLKQLLGADALEGYSAALRQQFGRELSPEKVERLQALQDHFGDTMAELSARSRASGTFLPDDWTKMQELQNAHHAELAKLLTPDELLDYDLRNSNTASQLRYDLGALHPTEEEFRALFPLYQALDAQFPRKSGPSTPEEMAPRQAADQQMQEQIKALLGADRYAEFQQAKNYNYQQTAKITDRLELPPAATGQVYAVQQDIEQRANAVRKDPALSPADRTAQLAGLATEANTRISGVLGAPGLEAYHQYAGQWLTNLTPRPRPAAPKD